MEVSNNGGTPIAGCFNGKSHEKMDDDRGYPFGNFQISSDSHAPEVLKWGLLSSFAERQQDPGEPLLKPSWLVWICSGQCPSYPKSLEDIHTVPLSSQMIVVILQNDNVMVQNDSCICLYIPNRV